MAACKVSLNDSTSMVCNAQGGLLSLGDYESDSDISKCIADDCDYQLCLNIVLTKSDSSIEMTLSTDFKGKTTRYEQSILSFKIYIENGNPINFTPEEKVVIYEDGKKTFKVK